MKAITLISIICGAGVWGATLHDPDNVLDDHCNTVICLEKQMRKKLRRAYEAMDKHVHVEVMGSNTPLRDDYSLHRYAKSRIEFLCNGTPGKNKCPKVYVAVDGVFKDRHGESTEKDTVIALGNTLEEEMEKKVGGWEAGYADDNDVVDDVTSMFAEREKQPRFGMGIAFSSENNFACTIEDVLRPTIRILKDKGMKYDTNLEVIPDVVPYLIKVVDENPRICDDLVNEFWRSLKEPRVIILFFLIPGGIVIFAICLHIFFQKTLLDFTDFHQACDNIDELGPGEYELNDGKGVEVYDNAGNFLCELGEGPQQVVITRAEPGRVQIEHPVNGWIILDKADEEGEEGTDSAAELMKDDEQEATLHDPDYGNVNDEAISLLRKRGSQVMSEYERASKPES